MWLSRTLRHPKRALAAGLGLALASLPIASLLRDDTTPAAPDRVVQFEPIAARAETPSTMLPLEAALPQAPPQQGEQPAPDAPPSPEPVSPAPVAPEPVATPVPEAAFETLAVVDPLTNTETTPVAFSDLPAVEATAPAASAETEVAVYVPGSIGKAKRQWAGGGSPAEQAGASRVTIVGGGGHCPVPGRVIPPYKGDFPKPRPSR